METTTSIIALSPSASMPKLMENLAVTNQFIPMEKEPAVYNKINTIKGKQYANSKNYSGKFRANVSKPLTQQKSYYKTYKR